MDIVTGIIKLLFGSKADKDRKAIEPYVNKIKEVYPSIAALSNDELRGRSQALMKQIADFIAPRRGAHRHSESAAGTRRNRTRREREDFEGDRRDHQTHRREDRTKARRNPARSVRHHEGYGASFRRERNGHGHGQRFRPAAGRLEGFRHDRRRQGRLRHPLARGRQRRQMGHGALRRAALRRRGAPQGQDRRDGHGRRKDPRSDAPRIPQRTGTQGRAHGDGQQLPGQARLRMDGPDVRIPRTVGGLHRRYAAQFRRPAASLHGRHHLRHEQRIRLRLSARQHGLVAQRPRAAQASLRHRRRGRLGAHRRRPHAADHLRSCPQGRRPALRAVPPRHRESLQSPKRIW